MFRSEVVMKRRRSSGRRMDEKNVGLRVEQVSRPKAFFDPSPRTNSAVVNGEGYLQRDPNGGD